MFLGHHRNINRVKNSLMPAMLYTFTYITNKSALRPCEMVTHHMALQLELPQVFNLGHFPTNFQNLTWTIENFGYLWLPKLVTVFFWGQQPNFFKLLDQWPLLTKGLKFFGWHNVVVHTKKKFGCCLWWLKVGDQNFHVCPNFFLSKWKNKLVTQCGDWKWWWLNLVSVANFVVTASIFVCHV